VRNLALVNTKGEKLRQLIGSRLKAERERLGLNQAEFAALGGASKRSQVDWEQGKLVPNAEFLAQLAGQGVDVQFVLTGIASSTTLSPEENELVISYRKLDVRGKARLLGLADGMNEAETPKAVQRNQEINFHGRVGHQVIGDITAPVYVGRKKK